MLRLRVVRRVRGRHTNLVLGRHGRKLGLHALANDSLFAFEFFLAGLLQFLLEVVVRCTGFHNLLHLVLGIFDNLVRPLFLCLQELDPIVKPDAVQLDLLPTLPDLRNRHGLLHRLLRKSGRVVARHSRRNAISRTLEASVEPPIP